MTATTGTATPTAMFRVWLELFPDPADAVLLGKGVASVLDEAGVVAGVVEETKVVGSGDWEVEVKVMVVGAAEKLSLETRVTTEVTAVNEVGPTTVVGAADDGGGCALDGGGCALGADDDGAVEGGGAAELDGAEDEGALDVGRKALEDSLEGGPADAVRSFVSDAVIVLVEPPGDTYPSS